MLIKILPTMSSTEVRIDLTHEEKLLLLSLALLLGGHKMTTAQAVEVSNSLLSRVGKECQGR